MALHSCFSIAVFRAIYEVPELHLGGFSVLAQGSFWPNQDIKQKDRHGFPGLWG